MRPKPLSKHVLRRVQRELRHPDDVLDRDRLRRCPLPRNREALRKGFELKDYEFNAHSAELGQA